METDAQQTKRDYIPKEKIRQFIENDIETEKDVFMRNEEELVVKELEYIVKKLKRLLGE